MSRLIAYMANDADRTACALYPARKLLVAPVLGVNPPIDSWGIGFYQGEMLLQRRPKAPTEPVDFYGVLQKLRTDVAIGHVRAGTVGQPKDENTHPFRFRSWLFAHHGTVPQFGRIRDRILERVPDFLQRNVRGQTDSEHLFHLFLSFMHERGKLDDPQTSTVTVRDALRDTLLFIEKQVGAEARTAECAIAVTSGRVLVATRQGGPVHVLRIEGIHDCPVCRERQPQFSRQQRRFDHEHLRSVLIIADPPDLVPTSGWQEVPQNHFVLVSHDLRVEFSPLYV